jgi:hypothetical protein
VEAEEVGWVVLVLQLHKTLVVLAEGLAYQLIPFFEEAGEGQVRAAPREEPTLSPKNLEGPFRHVEHFVVSARLTL